MSPIYRVLMRRGSPVLLALCVFAIADGQVKSSRTAKADFFVATNGSDAWSGKLAAPNSAKTDGPFASVPRAQAAVREFAS
jgi:hypothetical protein